MTLIPKRARVLIGVSLALVALAAVSASPALAAPEWRFAKPEWRQGGAELTSAVATKWKGTVNLTYGEVSDVVECEDTGEGTAGAGAAGTETKWTFSKCVTRGGDCEEPELSAVHLPWNTELTISEGSVRDSASEDGKGAPGIGLACTVLKTRVKVSCTGSLAATMKGVTAGVEATFTGDKLSGCGEGWTLGGKQVIEAVSGSKLEAVSAGAFHAVTSALTVKGSGVLTLTDVKWGESAKCEVEIKGTVEALGKGTITSYGVSKCSNPECPLEAQDINVPWDTELYLSKEELRDSIVSGGSGTPEFDFTCKVSGIKYEDVCGLNTNPKVLNFTEGYVQLNFTGSSKTNCTRGGAESGEWSGTLTIHPPEGIGALMGNP